jgi:response regulator RpfG family c-di-GMP phosphodiesterase
MSAIRMLMVDDRMLTSELDRAGYKQMGISVRHVSDFKKAQEILDDRQWPVDVMVINYDYERVDALQTSQYVKSKYQDVLVVITSVQSSAAVRKKAERASADLFIEQPIPRQMFVEKIKKHLDQIVRSDARISLKNNARILLGTKSYEFPILDLSTTGLFLKTDAQIPAGETVFLSFELPNDAKDIEVRGSVVRAIMNKDEQIGLGIKFEEFKAHCYPRLEKYVLSHGGKNKELLYYI